MASEGLEKKSSRTEYLISFLALVAIVVGIGLIDHFVTKKHDETTRIENARVIGFEKSKGGRRSLPSYRVIVQELGKTEPTKVSVSMAAWVLCDVGELLRDLPGEDPECYNLGALTAR